MEERQSVILHADACDPLLRGASPRPIQTLCSSLADCVVGDRAVRDATAAPWPAPEDGVDTEAADGRASKGELEEFDSEEASGLDPECREWFIPCIAPYCRQSIMGTETAGSLDDCVGGGGAVPDATAASGPAPEDCVGTEAADGSASEDGLDDELDSEEARGRPGPRVHGAVHRVHLPAPAGHPHRARQPAQRPGLVGSAPLGAGARAASACPGAPLLRGGAGQIGRAAAPNTAGAGPGPGPGPGAGVGAGMREATPAPAAHAASARACRTAAPGTRAKHAATVMQCGAVLAVVAAVVAAEAAAAQKRLSAHETLCLLIDM